MPVTKQEIYVSVRDNINKIVFDMNTYHRMNREEIYCFQSKLNNITNQLFDYLFIQKEEDVNV